MALYKNTLYPGIAINYKYDVLLSVLNLRGGRVFLLFSIFI